MKLVDIKIENFRGIRSLALPLGALTVVIGENNAGKSTILETLRIILTSAFSNRRNATFSDYDFHLVDSEATPQTADPIRLLLHFAEQEPDEWPDPPEV